MPPDLDKKVLRPTLRKYQKWLDAEDRRAKAREYRQRVRETNEVLQEQGYQPDEDYKRSRAISFAKKLESELQTD